jgi:hypothetical protein
MFSFRLIKIGAYVVVAAIFALSVAALVNRHEVELIRQFAALQQVDPLPKAKEFAAAGEYCQALEYLDYFMEYPYVKDDPDVRTLYDEIQQKRNSYAFIGSDIASGVWRGTGACPEALVSATASDFFLVGDVRDLLLGMTKKYYYGEEADEFTMALASVGIVATGLAYLSGGAGTPLKGSLSLLKTAKKLDKLPQPLQKSLIASFKEVSHTGDLKPIIPVAGSLYAISKTPGMKVRDVFAVLSRSRNIDDLKVMEKVAGKYGAKTGKFMHLGGEAPVNVLRRFPNDAKLVAAVDSAVTYGSPGANLLVKTGPTKFLRYLALTKYSARAGRSLWEGRLSTLLVKTIQLLPDPAIMGIGLASGLIALGLPLQWMVRRVRARRA